MILKKRNYDLALFLKACNIVNNKNHTNELGQLELRSLASRLSSKLSLDSKRNLPESTKSLNKD